MSKCENCKKYEDCRDGSGLTWPCGAYRPIVITNAERIRAMNDEELAGFLEGDYGNIETGHAIDWLRQPSKEE